MTSRFTTTRRFLLSALTAVCAGILLWPAEASAKAQLDLAAEVQKLQKDNARLTEELRKATILMDVQRKLGTLLGWPLPTQEEIDKLL